jgi:hypothetical protein
LRRALCLVDTFSSSSVADDLTMNINWTAFTPWSALIGGALIGIAAAILTLSFAGLRVGVGTRYAAGLTSVHAVCGLRHLDPAC